MLSPLLHHLRLDSNTYRTEGVLLPNADVTDVDLKAKFHQACIDVAVTAAEGGAPIQKQPALARWMLDEIEAACGYRPNQRDVKEALAAAMPARDLRYVSSKKGASGYYPFDIEQLELLAEQARLRRAEAKTKSTS
jgi:hypothetical protein